MIIELPVLPISGGMVQRYRMGFFHFSNNNLSIRRECAIELGKYDPVTRTSEDVDICFRTAQSKSWVACREPGVIVRHKARKTFPAMVKQLWGWGINLGRPYSKTGIKGIYLYWVSSKVRTITRSVEIKHFPFLVTGFFTDFHLAHVLAVLAVVLGLAWTWIAGAALGVLAAFLLGRALQDALFCRMGLVRTVQMTLLHYVANLVFITAAFCSGLRFRMILIPASIYAPGSAPEASPFQTRQQTPTSPDISAEAEPAK